MTDFLSANGVMLVLFLSLAGWCGIFLILLRIDRSLTMLEKKLSSGNTQ